MNKNYNKKVACERAVKPAAAILGVDLQVCHPAYAEAAAQPTQHAQHAGLRSQDGSTLTQTNV